MSIEKYRRKRPFRNFLSHDFFDMDDFFDNRGWAREMLPDKFWNGKRTEPAINVKEGEDHFEIELAAPGFAKKDFNVTIGDGFLNISAAKEATDQEEEENFTRREFSYVAFERSMRLPDNVKEEAIKASYNDGILSFKLAKKEENKKSPPKVIEVS